MYTHFAAISVNVTQKLLCLYVLHSFTLKVSCRPSLIFKDSVLFILWHFVIFVLCVCVLEPALDVVFLWSYTIIYAILILVLDTSNIPSIAFLIDFCTLSFMFFFPSFFEVTLSPQPQNGTEIYYDSVLFFCFCWMASKAP